MPSNLYNGTTQISGNNLGAKYLHIGLTYNTAYTYIIKACNSVGCSEESAAVSATTQDLNIEVNENVANANKGTLRYKWESASPGSDVFDDYNVTQSAFLLTRGAITLAINGKRFRCVVSNEEDSVTSSVVTLTVNPQGLLQTRQDMLFISRSILKD